MIRKLQGRKADLHRSKRPQAASALTQGAKAASDFFFIRAIFAFAGFAGALKSPLGAGQGVDKANRLTE